MGENITSNIINNYSKHILKPLDNNNVNNSCWINSALYLISAHPYIMFQYLLLDNSRLTEKDKKIYNDIYFKNIIYNYKYIKSEKNINSKILYNEELHKKLYKKIKFNNLFDVPNIWGNTWDAIPTIDLLFTIITKKHSIINTNMYLTIEGRILKNYKDIDKLLKIKDGITTEKDKLLLGFVTGTKCNKYDIHNYGNQDLDAVHWISYFRESLNDDKLWYKFDGLKNKGTLYRKEYIYDCIEENYNKNLMCIYIDIHKFKKILSNNDVRQNYHKFIKLISNNDNNDNNDNIFENIMKKIPETVGKNKYIDINLLSIPDLEFIYKNKIKKDYYTKNIIDKRAYFINLN